MGKRSSGCITCRKRKVKCDEAKPKCNRCAKATYACAGYDEPWPDERPYIALALRRAAESERHHRARLDEMIPRAAVTAEGYLPLEKVTQPLNLSAFQDDICRSFTFHKLTTGPDVSKSMSWWLSPAPRAEIQSRTLISATRALSAAFFGRIQQQPRIALEGAEMYSKAMLNLSEDLSHDLKAFTFETLGATMALNMYELVYVNSKTVGWITHAGGVSKLIQARGPARHKTYPEKSMYEECRMLLTVTGIFSCQRTFLDERKWKDIPWEEDEENKIPFDYLVDVLSDVPCFLEQASRTQESPASAAFERQLDSACLLEGIIERLKYLKEIRADWHAKYENPFWEIPPTPHSPAIAAGRQSPALEPPFQTVLYFPNMLRAYDFCAYNATLILLFMLHEQLSRDQHQAIVSQASAPTLDTPYTIFPEKTVQNLAQDICRCTEYLLLDIHGALGYIVFTFPASVAYLAIDEDCPEAKWLYAVCKTHARSSGFGFGDFVLDRATPLSKFLHKVKAGRASKVS